MNSYVFNTIFASNTLFMVMKNEEFLEKYEILEKNKQYKKKMIVNIYINNCQSRLQHMRHAITHARLCTLLKTLETCNKKHALLD